MAESLESFKSYIGKSETANDVVTASMLVKFRRDVGIGESAAGKGLTDSARLVRGSLPRVAPTRQDAHGRAGLGWRHRAADSVAAPAHRRDARFVSCTALRRGRNVTCKTEIGDIQIDEGSQGAMATVVERKSLSTGRGLCVVEERDTCMLSEQRAEAAPKSAPAVPGEAKWQQVVEPNAPLLFRFSAIRFNSHRIHYDRDYVTKVEKLPGLVVQSSLISQLLMEMCRRELPNRRMTNFDFQNLRSVYDTSGKVTLAGAPSADGREAKLWALDGEGKLSMLVTAKFA